METRSWYRKSEEIRRMIETQNNEEEPDNDDLTDDESDNEEEIIGSDEDYLEEIENSSSDGEKSDEDIISKEAERMKRCRTAAPRSTQTKYIYGRNRYKWSLEPPGPRARSRSPGEQVYVSRGVEDGGSVIGEGAAWSLLLPDETLEKIVVHTNERIMIKRANFSSDPTFTHNIDLCELKAFIGLLYYSGLQGSSRRNIKQLYGKLSSPIFHATMSRQRFEFILSTLSFDDKTTRLERKQTDKLAPIREVWDTFIRNSNRNYSPGHNVTIDEQLLSFRGRCAFRVYIRSKPDRYGLKILTINDSETAYLFDAIPYIGRVAVDPSESAPAHYVQQLSKSIVGSNRNITCNNWFTSIPLVEKLKTQASLTLVGTIRKDEREIPEAMKTISEIRGSKFAYANGMTLVSYSPKKNKVVFLVSSMHKFGRISSDREKPEIILYYNKTKGGTDTFDQMCHEYTVTRGTRLWPLRFFYGILDQSSINAFILFSLNKDNNLIRRREFIENLVHQLVSPFLERRLTVSTLRVNVRALIEQVLGIDFSTEQIPDIIDYTLDKQIRCAFCPRNKDKKTKYVCSKCRLPRCQDHRSMQCTSCAPN